MCACINIEHAATIATTTVRKVFHTTYDTEQSSRWGNKSEK